MSEKLFIVLPGPVTSKNDWECHRITATQLMDLFGVRPDECIVIRDVDDLVGQRDIFERGMTVLEPRVSGLYKPVTDLEREGIRAEIARKAAS